MVVTSYTAYLQDLKVTIDRIRERPFEFDRAEVQVAICKDGFAYRCRDAVKYGQLFSEHRMGPMNIDNWCPDDKHLSRAEVDEFFSLPAVFAYSDRVLQADSNPLSTMHWDATIGIVEIELHERHKPPRSQRMLFAGFFDRRDAAFLHAVDNEFIVHDNRTGTHFYEWRENVPDETPIRRAQAWSPKLHRLSPIKIGADPHHSRSVI